MSTCASSSALLVGGVEDAQVICDTSTMTEEVVG